MTLSFKSILLTCLMTCGWNAVAAEELTAKDIMQRNFDVSRISDVTMTNRLTLFNPSGQTRLRITKGASKLQKNGVDYSRMIKFLEPADVRGTGVLTIEHSGGDDDVWVYLPALKKSRRIASSEKSSSFMGTEFSYADILSPKVEDYRHTLLRTETHNGVDCFVIESLPVSAKVEEETGYSRKVSWIRKDNFVENKVEYFDQTNTLLKTLVTENITELDTKRHKWMPLKRDMTNHQTNRRTMMEMQNVRANTGVKEDQFTIKYLERQ
jgi:outer membrane lipoprotein-sorting protein